MNFIRFNETNLEKYGLNMAVSKMAKSNKTKAVLLGIFLGNIFLVALTFFGSPIAVVEVNATSRTSTTPIKIMVFNIKESGESSSHPDWKEVVYEENADIIMFVETGYWEDNSDAKLNQYVNEFNNYFTNEDPYEGETTQGISYSTSGEAVMSRYPISSTNQIEVVPLDSGSNYDVTHDFFDATVQVDGTDIHFIGGHLKAMTGSINEERREREMEGIINYMDNLGNVPIVYLGDFNSFSPEDIGINNLQSGLGYGPCTMLVEPSDPTYGQYSSTAHTFTDVHRSLNPTDLGITNPSYDSRIDFLYVNQLLSDKISDSTTGDTAHALTGSDHLTVDVMIDLGGPSGDMGTGADAYNSYSAHDSATILSTPISGTGELTYSSDQYDQYKVAVNAGDQVTIDITAPSTATSLDIPIYDTTKSTFFTRYNIGTIHETVTASGNGYIYITFDADASGDTGTYSMSISVSGGAPVDTTPPTVSISAPTNGATVSGTTTISFTASDANGISSRSIKIDGVTKSTSSSYSWDTTAYNNGQHTIACSATDPSGNTGSDTHTVTVSNTVTDDGGQLTNSVTATGHMSSADGADMWYIDVSANAESMYVVLTCGSADFDTFGRYGTEPTTSVYDWRGYTGGGEENTVTNPQQGRHYIMVDYYSGDSDYSLTATITYGSSNVDQIVINEFLPAPQSTYTTEWIELYNPTSQAIDIGGCILDDITSGGTTAYTIPSGTTIPAYGYQLFYQSTTGVTLNNAGDTCNFISSSGTVIDSRSYSSSSYDVSIGRDSDGSSTWTTFTSPTPGATNGGTTPPNGPPYTFTGTCGSDQWYDIYLVAGNTVQISLSWSGSTDLDWFLYRSDGSTEVARGYTVSNPESGTWNVDSTGWFKICVNKYSGIDVAFTLTVTYI